MGRKLVFAILVSALLTTFILIMPEKHESSYGAYDFHLGLTWELAENSQTHQCRLWGMVASS